MNDSNLKDQPENGAVISIDENNIIIDWNQQAQNLFDWNAEEVIGKSLSETILPFAIENLPVNQRMELSAIKKSGAKLPVELSIVAVKVKGLNHYFAIFRDLTEQKQESFLREERENRNRFLSEVSMILNSSLDLKETLRLITDLAVPNFGDWCYIHLPDKNGQLTLTDTAVAYDHLAPELNEFLELLNVKGSSANAVLTVYQTGNAVMRNGLNDEYYQKVSGSPKHLALFRKLAPKCVIVVPLKSLGKLLGTITVSYTQNKSYSEFDLRLLEDVAIRAGVALENARLYTESKKAIKYRDEFVSVASHELKTPLTSLMLLNQITQKKMEKGELQVHEDLHWKKTLNEYNVHIKRMSHLVEVMLDITRIQLGSYELNITECDIGDCLNQTCDNLLPQLKSANCPLDIQINGNLVGSFDNMKIQQVISNIVTNSFKYAPGKPIHILAEGLPDTIKMSIRDEGHGIEKDNLQRIFEKFERATSPSDVSGLGLGLYISRIIIEAHGGRLWAESTIDEGTTLHIEIPR